MKFINILFLITIWFCKLFTVKEAKLPPEIQKCKSTNNDNCIGKAIEEVLKRYPTGNPDFGLPNISALNATNVRVSRSNPDSPIQINFEFINCTIYGLEKLKVLRTAGFDKELDKVEIDFLFPHVNLKGFYKMTGKMLLLPMNGQGDGEIYFYEIKVSTKTKVEKIKRDGKTYLKVKKHKVLFEPKTMTVKLDNVFNGNPVLSQTINDVINENWKDVWAELQDGTNNAIGDVVRKVIDEIYQVLTIEDMYLD